MMQSITGAAVACTIAGTPGTAASQALPAVFSYRADLPLVVDSGEVTDRDGIRLLPVSFASPGGGRVTGMLALPNAGGRRPAVLLMHGLPGNARSVASSLGVDLARRGAVALAIDATWSRRGGLPDFTVRDSVEQVQLIQDLRRAVDYLVGREDVDSARIGYIGGSYGGAMGVLFVAAEKRLRAANLFVPDGGLVSHLTDASGKPEGPLADLPARDRTRWLAAMRPIEPLRFAGLTSPVPLLIQNGRDDPFVTRDDAEALHSSLGYPREIIWYDAGHNLASLPEARRDRARFLAEHLGIPAEG